MDHPSIIEESSHHHFTHWLLMTNLFHPGFATVKPCLWLTLHFRIIMMNPGFINSDDMREKAWILGVCVIFSEHTEQWWSISLAQRKRGTHIEQISFIPMSFVKMRWIGILRCVSHLPAFKQMDDSPLQSPLTLCWCWLCHNSSQFSVSRLSAQFQQTAVRECSMASANGRIMQSFILENFFQ